ncbi:MAG TPA: hypothetical protein PLP17_08460, partial [Oligoflexia bacterium]|nr:hypothetical protein [Oligoflexia bacterium]
MLGILCSAVLHILGAVIAIVIWEHNAASASRPAEIFSVTLEGGEKLGGITQVPKEGGRNRKPLVDVDALPYEEPKKGGAKDEDAGEAKAAEKKLEAPSAVDDPEKILAEKRKLEEAEKKKAAERKAADEKKKKEELEKKKAQDAKAKAEEAAKQAAADKKKLDDERKARDRQLAAATNRMRVRYDGESANAGGVGFGAARLGGTGMGGGTLAPAEKIAYADTLQQHVKSGWHWLPGSARLQAEVRVRILPSGVIQDVR